MVPITITAFIWGLLSATFFFIVPDVFLTGVAVRNGWKGLWCCLVAVIGAGLGGLLLYIWAHAYPVGAFNIIAAIPGVDEMMIETAQIYLIDRQIFMPLISILFGAPIKAYIVAAGTIQYGLPPILALTLPPLLLRFAILTAVFWWLSQYLWSGWSRQNKQIVHALFWMIFYAAYFTARSFTN